MGLGVGRVVCPCGSSRVLFYGRALLLCCEALFLSSASVASFSAWSTAFEKVSLSANSPSALIVMSLGYRLRTASGAMPFSVECRRVLWSVLICMPYLYTASLKERRVCAYVTSVWKGTRLMSTFAKSW